MARPAAPKATPEWDRPIVAWTDRTAERRRHPRATAMPTVEDAINAWLHMRSYSPTTVRGAREHLESARARGWREEHGIVTIDQLTADAARDYILYLRDRGASPATLRKAKTLFGSLAVFCAETPGYEACLRGTALTTLRLPPLVERIPRALSEEECIALIEACELERDRVIVETFLLAGLRVSELCALTIDAVYLDSRPAYLDVRGSVHNPHRPKTPRERRVIIDYDVSGFGRGYVGRLRQYLASVRPPTDHRELFLSSRRSRGGEFSPLTREGVEQVMDRLEQRTGIHCNPHKLRHTFATRCVDKGVPMFHLQDALGHRSLDMVRRDYTHSRHAQAEGFYRAFASSAV